MKLVGNLPAIESLIVNAIDDEQIETKLAPSSTNFKKVAIHHSKYGSDHLARIIRSCRRLEEFEFSIGGRCPNDGSLAGIDKVDLLNALSFHTQTLRVLDLDVDDEFWDLDWGDDYDEEEYEDEEEEEDSANWKKVFAEEHQLPSLKDFPALTSLSIGIKFLAATARGRAREGQPIEAPVTVAEILPPNLEYLRIRGYNPGADPKDDAMRKLPHLSKGAELTSCPRSMAWTCVYRTRSPSATQTIIRSFFGLTRTGISIGGSRPPDPKEDAWISCNCQ